ncbi:diguanylate cyclase domain-containing protein [Kineococcus sp. SYSU DK003]|uniref:diguanylate cyclase domain-containing protein n=1 Tax=Kineococcus sp. SYSU DK003 TaxID=3383124 RepID=UPI003D7C6854
MDAQSALLAELHDLVTAGRPDLEVVLGTVVTRLAQDCGVTSVRVDDTGPAGDARVLPLRLFGEDLGRLTVRGHALGRLRPDVAHAVAHHVAVLLQAAAAHRARALDAAAADAVRRLFEEGTRATSVQAAGEVLARVTAQALGTESVAVHLTDADGRVHEVLDLGVSPRVAAALRAQVVGGLAGDSPVWRQAQRDGGPVLADDAAARPGRPGGFIECMGLRSYAAMPLLSASGAVGMVVCGDVSGQRSWTERDRQVAHQLAMQGALVVDSARLRQAEQAHVEELRHRADHDPLTALPNRRRLLAEVAAALPAERGALLLFDLDGFKQVNDTLGHPAGDELLRAVGRRLRREVRDGDLAARLGGDEFAVLVTGTSAEETAELAERLCAAVRRPVEVDGAQARVGASVGIALLADHGRDVAGLLRAADAAMYGRKRTARAGAPVGAVATAEVRGVAAPPPAPRPVPPAPAP